MMTDKLVTKIWGREFTLDVYYKTYQGKKKEIDQIDSYYYFLNDSSELQKSKEKLIAYIEKNYKNELNGKTIENIFKYVLPKTLYISSNTDKRLVAVLCDFRFDEEHGLAIIFEKEKFQKIASQDDIL